MLNYFQPFQLLMLQLVNYFNCCSLAIEPEMYSIL